MYDRLARGAMEELKYFQPRRRTMRFPSNTRLDVMDRLQDQFLQQATFEAQDAEYHLIRQTRISNMSEADEESLHHGYENAGQYEVFLSDSGNPTLPTIFTESHQDSNEDTLGTLRCVFQKTRPQHISGHPDSLPFQDVNTLLKVFDTLDLPSSYFQIADGSLATALAYTFSEQDGHPYRFELVAHCLTKQGDWAMALSHRAKTRATSVFLSVDQRVKSDSLTDDLQTFSDYSIHPMLLPCIIFSATFRMAVHRRHMIKNKVGRLEKAMASITNRPLSTAESELTADEENNEIAHLFELLQSCRKDQASRKGRTDFWQSFQTAINEGFKYSEKILAASHDEQFHKAHNDLHHWMTLVWQRLQSLNERDKDHINRVDNLSHMLYNLVQQRDMRLQSSIARASLRDSEDMKFIAVLGSVFLPASLVATVLNVPEFQFLPGAELFAAYVGITIPFIILVVIVCFTRPYWARWYERLVPARLSPNKSRNSILEQRFQRSNTLAQSIDYTRST